MPLLGSAAMLLSFEVADEALAEHDHWHTHEHLPERLSIPGFLRGSRWVSPAPRRRYLVLYEVERLAVLTSAAYLERLDHPSAWTAKMMPHYRAMTRGLCTVTCSLGLGLGGAGLVLRFRPGPGEDAALRRWLCDEALPDLPLRPGLGSVHLLEAAATPAMTAEQRIRGSDAAVHWALVVTGHGEPALAELARGEALAGELARHGALEVASALYRLEHLLVAAEMRGPDRPGGA